MRKLVIYYGYSNYEIKDIPVGLSFDTIGNKFQQASNINKIKLLYMFDTDTDTFCCWSTKEAGYLMGSNKY